MEEAAAGAGSFRVRALQQIQRRGGKTVLCAAPKEKSADGLSASAGL